LVKHRASITSESGSGLPERVPTPNANDCKPAGEKEIAMMRLYHGGQSIPDTYKRLRGHVAARVPTPLASDANAPGFSPGRQGSQSLSVVVRVPTPTVCGNYNRKGVTFIDATDFCAVLGAKTVSTLVLAHS
jgi:hypothetical protein